jgi:AcrR family transcriptional regulator
MTLPNRLPREERAALQRAERRSAILGAAVDLAATKGYRNLGRDVVAQMAGVALGSVNHEFGTIDALRDAVVVEAVRTESLPIIAQAIVDGHGAVADLPAELKKRALDSVTA